jgi:hypothetical protein
MIRCLMAVLRSYYWAVRTVTRISRSRGGIGITRAVSMNPLAGFPSILAEAMAWPVDVRG